MDGERLCLGADVLDTAANRMTRFVAPVTLLATGGAGQAYPITTNPSVATGDGCVQGFHHCSGFKSNISEPLSCTFLALEVLWGCVDVGVAP